MFNETDPCGDESDSMLAEVDFKWLMTGQGQGIDMARFRCDAIYAAECLGLALASESFALRECAALLQTRKRALLT